MTWWILSEGVPPIPAPASANLAMRGWDEQLDFYLRRGLESGLTRAQITEALTHLGFYAGWAKATKAMAAVTRTLGK